MRADTYTSAERHARDVEMVLASPQLVGYVSELPKPGSYCTKTVMGRSILLTRTSDGSVKAFENVCLHRQSQITEGCGVGASARLSVPRVELRPRRQPGRRAGQGGISRELNGQCEVDRTPGHRMRRLPLDRARPGRHARHPRLPRTAGRRTGLLGHRTLVAAGREGAGLRRSTGSSRSTPSRRTTTSRPCTRPPSRPSRAATARCSTRSARTTDWCSRSTASSTSTTFPKSSGSPCRTWSSSTRCSPTSCCRRRSPTASCSGSTPATFPAGRSPCTRTRRRWTCRTSPSAAGAQAVFDYAHGTVRDEDYALVEKLQANLASGAREHLVFGRNEPGLQHRHETWTNAISGAVPR